MSDAHQRRILYLEDHPELAEVVIQGLQLEDHSIDWVSNGAEALERIQRSLTDYDVLILDEHVDGPPGSAVAREARAAGFRGGILVLTGEVDPGERARIAACGVTLVLEKPIGLFDLLAHLQTLP